MSRYRYILETAVANNTNTSLPNLIGIFPFNTLIDKEKTNVQQGKIEFLETAISGLKILGESKTNVVLFINQFKDKALSYEQFNSLNQAVEGFVSQFGVTVLGVYWCPVTDKRDPYVVPNSGMFTRATENQKINWENVPVLGSSENDLLAASKVKALPIKIGNGPSKWTHYQDLGEWIKSV